MHMRRAREMTLEDAMVYAKTMLYVFEQDFEIMSWKPTLVRITKMSDKTRKVYPFFMTLRGVEQVLQYKTVWEYIIEEISRILKSPHCYRAKTYDKCWSLAFIGSSVGIVWYD